LKVYKKLNLRVHAHFDGLLNFLLFSGWKIKQVVFPYGPGNLNVDLHNLLVYVRFFCLIFWGEFSELIRKSKVYWSLEERAFFDIFGSCV